MKVRGSRRPATRRQRGAALVAVAAATAVAVIAAFASQQRAPAGAFASAPPGTYAVVLRATETVDAVVAVPLADPGPGIVLGSVAHLPGHAASGSVSPDGARVALVVADGGAVSHPTASLVVVDLHDGSARRLASDIDPLQSPPWDPWSSAVLVSRTSRVGGAPSTTVLKVGVSGKTETVAVFPGALGAFPFAFDAEGNPWLCVIDGRGSTVYRGNQEMASLGPYITRDWELSPDGRSVAYVETNTDSGLRYYARVTATTPGFSRATLAAPSAEALGVAWRPGAPSPTFGTDPSMAMTASGGGFDVPIAYSPNGEALAVQHWSGTSYDKPGVPALVAITAEGRTSLEPANRFLGWAQR